MRTRSSKNNKRNNRNKMQYVNIALSIILAGVYQWLMVLLFSYRILSMKLILAISVVVLIVLGVMYYFKVHKSLLVTQIILVLLAAFGIQKINVTIDSFAEMNHNAAIQEERIYVLALKDSPANSLADLAGQAIAAPTKFDMESIEQLTDVLNEHNISFKETSSYIAAYQELIDGTVPAMVLNDTYASLIMDLHPDYLDQTKIIYEANVTVEPTEPVAETPVDKDKVNKKCLNIYLSGIDTYGSLSTVSRSDTNVIVTVNKESGEILLTNTPRDSYVRVPGPGNNQYDKLTHAGIYGVKTSMETLEELYDIDIDYYARVNFTSLINLVRALGGIEVYNSQAFVSRVGNVSFPEGNITLTGDTVLPFVRERYSLTGGDFDRGRNHEKVIAAIIKKLISPAILVNYDSYLKAISSSIQTDLTLEDIATLVNEQIASGQEYTFQSQDLSGHGSTSTTCYSMQGPALYVMNVDETSLQQMKANMKQVMKDK